ncbi:MAG: alpha/beta hydrolase [Pseudomonadota bacterium]
MERLLVLRFCLMLMLGLGIAAPAQAFLFFSKQRTESITYTPAGWPQRLGADLYLPKDKDKAPYPVVLLIHGGAWHKGDRRSMEKAGKLLAARGYAALAIDYRLAPRFRYPAPVEDAQQALRWLSAHAGQHRLDMNRVGVWGYSAGAHLAALLAMQPPTTDVPQLRVVVAGSAPTDLRQSRQSSVRAFLGATPEEQPALYEEASPLAKVRPGLPAFLLYYGSADTLVEPAQSERLGAALKEAGVTVRMLRLEGADHRSAGQALRPHIPEVLAFLARQMGSGQRAAAAP